LRVLIFHGLFELAGGGEKFALELARALELLGHEPMIITFYRDREAFERSFKLLSQNYRPSVKVRPVPIMHKILDVILDERLVRLKRLFLVKRFLEDLKYTRREFNLIIDTASNIPTSVDISYIHYPTVAPGYSSGIIYGLYHRIVRWYARRYQGIPRLILANSSWTADKISKFYSINRNKIWVLHPPVEVEYFSEAISNERKENLIVTLSRFTPEKRLYEILKAAEILPNYKFLMVGTAGRYSQTVISKMRGIIEKRKLDNVHLMMNIPRPQVRETLGKARFYLHPPFAEHFGISVVEAMAAGCIPIVYREGGAWSDIVSRVDEELGYNDISEVPSIVKKFENNRDFEERIRSVAMNISQEFSFERFKERLSKYLSLSVSMKIDTL
jgi:glycosyltransferase involved in cell wall biosynthesis